MNKHYGTILTENGFKKGYITVSNNEPSRIHFDDTISSPSSLIIPTLCNAHTHLGDTFIRHKKIPLPKTIEQLVAPPNGLKHQLLQTTSKQEILNGMIQGLKELQTNGISSIIDFRENGLHGLSLLHEALQKVPINSLVLGRPNSLEVSSKELDDLLKVSDGIGLSSVRDWQYDLVEFIAKKTKNKKKIFAVHASELEREPIQPILDLEPDFIVHMTKATRNDLLQVKKHDIPLVVCPRSNHFFGLIPNLKQMHELGNTILLGTDNSMLHQPSILKEIRWIQKYFPNLFSVEELFLMNTYTCRNIFSVQKQKNNDKSFPSWLIVNPQNYDIKAIVHNVEIS